MREFFERELKRYQNRRTNLATKLGNPENERLTQEVKFVKARMARDRGLFADKMKNLMSEIKQGIFRWIFCTSRWVSILFLLL